MTEWNILVCTVFSQEFLLKLISTPISLLEQNKTPAVSLKLNLKDK